MTCPKCGSTDLLNGPVYKRDAKGVESLLYVCRCGYHWRAPCKDAVAKGVTVAPKR